MRSAFSLNMSEVGRPVHADERPGARGKSRLQFEITIRQRLVAIGSDEPVSSRTVVRAGHYPLRHIAMEALPANDLLFICIFFV
jgi:hypothetical protein